MMVEIGHNGEASPVDVEYSPPRHLEGLPYEIVDRSEILTRKSDRDLALRQRSGFHQLILCTDGQGSHDVDFESMEFRPGALLRIHPGQVQRFVPEPRFDAHMLVWPVRSHQPAPETPTWYPGCDVPTFWQLDAELHSRVADWIQELRTAQEQFVDTPVQRALLQSLLTTLLLRLEVELPSATPTTNRLPAAYVAYRQAIETHLHHRYSVIDMAAALGYSTRTLDRACQKVCGLTARQVLDERLALEARRLLTHTSRPAMRIGEDLGFSDPANFSRFVKRHLGLTPGEVRRSL
jgi:AraC-like DNA-binding protein